MIFNKHLTVLYHKSSVVLNKVSIKAGVSLAVLMIVLMISAATKIYPTDAELERIDLPSLGQSLSQIKESMVNAAKEHLGKRYRFRNENGQTMDCSGFVRYIYSLQNIQLPRTATEQSAFSRQISLDEVEVGDLLFFKGRSTRSNRIGHVAMVSEKGENGLKMIHSSLRGVVIDGYPDMKYYRDRFLHAGRIDALYAMATPDSLLNLDYSHVQATVEEPPSRYSIIGVGDLMLGTNYPNNSYLPPDDGRDLLTPVKEIISGADLAFANLEGVILSGAGQVKNCADPNNCYAFKSPDHYAFHIKEAGFDLLSLANNHIGDFGEIGKENTVRKLEDAELKFAGLLEHPGTVFALNGITYGFAAFAPYRSTVKMNDYGAAREIIAQLDSLADVVIVSFHGGAEGARYRHITRQREVYLGEDRGNPYEFARMVIDAGADIVFGHGPHVSRAIDLYKGRFIAYSLGNFATYGRFNLSGSNGIAPIVKVNVDREGAFLDGEIISIKQVGRGGPVLDETNAALQEIISLTATDFPQSPLRISSDGKVQIRPLR